MTYDAERFCTNDQWGRRLYFDPLPADDTWDATDERWLSPSTKKKVFSKEFTKRLDTGITVPLDAWRVAAYAVDNLDTVAGLDKGAAVELLATAARRDLNTAATRGTQIHDLIEQLTHGQEPMIEFIPEAEPYMDAARAFVAECQPEVVRTERVVIHRGDENVVGYGGRFDAIATIGGRTWIVDYKTRAKHGAYGEEAAQLAAYARAHYLIDHTDGDYHRAPIPDVDGGLIVSIGADGTFRCYQIDLEAGWSYWCAMSQAHELKRTGQAAGRKAIGDPLHLAASKKTKNEDAARHDWIIGRIGAVKDAGHLADLVNVWPARTPTPSKLTGIYTTSQIDAIAEACRLVENQHKMPWFDIDPAEATDPPTWPEVDDLSATVARDDVRIASFRRRVDALPDRHAVWLRDEWTGPRIDAGSITERQLLAFAELLAKAEASAVFDAA